MDVYTPSSLAVPAPGLSVFSDWGPAPAQRSHGVVKLLLDTPTSEPELGTMIWIAGDTCDGWGGTVCSPALLRTRVPAPAFADAWRTLRIEGVQDTCTLRTTLDGQLLDTNAGNCTLTGGGVVLEGHEDSSFSRLRVYRGRAADCVP